MRIGNERSMYVSDFERTSMNAFDKAPESGDAVFIMDGQESRGVVLTKEKYESLQSEIEGLYGIHSQRTPGE
ncbi:hypothetical protein [Salinicoccus carnicancri]|uniref:hypothetical protein n=1 Tax=Salinicoccus carnicancri TaxID=558170 RepID=UPI000306ED0B|nr:hypothetical protein [Salinicoccus carnicancri]